MGRRILLAILGLFTSVAVAQAQAGRVTGTVTSADGGRPIPGVQITVTGTSRGALTDSIGRYTIAGVPVGNQTVVARSLGWAQSSTGVTLTTGATAIANFALVSAPTQLNPLVVTGYGTQDRRTVTG